MSTKKAILIVFFKTCFFLNQDAHCYKVLSHSNNDTDSLIISAHEDRKIRFFDTNSGKLVYQMVAHQDACTDLAIDPTASYLLSASKTLCFD